MPMVLSCLCVQVRLHILLQLDGLAEWMPAMAEQVGAELILVIIKRFETTLTELEGGHTFRPHRT